MLTLLQDRALRVSVMMQAHILLVYVLLVGGANNDSTTRFECNFTCAILTAASRTSSSL